MGEVSHPGRCGGARPNRHALRARIAAALDSYLAEHSQADVGTLLGVAATTIGRRGPDLAAWPATDLLIIAAADAPLAESMMAYLAGADAEPVGNALAVRRDLAREIAAGAAVSAEIADALEESRVTAKDATRILAKLDDRGHVEAELRRDLQALVESERQAVR